MSRRRIRLPQEPQTASISDFSHEGRGIAKSDGKVIFIQGALPNEKVTFKYTNRKKDYDEGTLLSVEQASPLRVEPQCSHFWMCGGCTLQHLKPEEQIKFKQNQLVDLLSRIGKVNPLELLPPLVSPMQNYRNKARLSVRYVEKKSSVLIGFREKNNPRFITDISSCSVLNAQVEAELLNLRELINRFSDPTMIAQIEVAAGDEEVALIFRNMTELSGVDQAELIAFGERTGFKLFLQPKGPDSVFLFYPQNAQSLLSYQLPDHQIKFSFHPIDFIQVNTTINRAMINLAIELLGLQPEDNVLDLFCGLGNFSLPMAKYCQQVVGVEGSEYMVNRAEVNAVANQLTNTRFFTANLDDSASFQKFKSLNVNKVLLDPPRTGAEKLVQQINLINPEVIVYVSCNPATLARDAGILVHQHGYDLEKAGVMDMFPHTAHVESIALFTKKR